MRELSFIIPGRVGGKGRGRATIRHGRPSVYTPSKTVNAEAMVRDFGAAAIGRMPLMAGALCLIIFISINMPSSWSKRKRLENPIPTGKPDLDNVAKLIGDALNGVVWQDDSQIANLAISRAFQDGGGETTTITVREIVGVTA